MRTAVTATAPANHPSAQTQGRLRRREPSFAAPNTDADRYGWQRPPPRNADWASRDSVPASFGSLCLGSEAVIAVIDECGGIPADDLGRVFDVAFRGDVARRRDSAGGGLGLAIAKGLVEAQDGCIDVSNRPGGCCFTVRLPLATGEGR